MSNRSQLKILYSKYITSPSNETHNAVVQLYNSFTGKDRLDESIFTLYLKFKNTKDMMARFALTSFLVKYN